jgi:uncharacterized membrane protein
MSGPIKIAGKNGGSMATCSKCGSAVSEGASFCGVCGSPVSAVNIPVVPPPPPPPGAGMAPGAASVGSNSQIAAAAAYIPFLGWVVAIILLFIEPYRKDAFVRFHAFQSIWLSVILFVIRYILVRFVWTFFTFGFLWRMFSLFLSVYMLAVLLLGLFLMYQAYNRQKFSLPVIGDFAAKQAAK